MNWIVVDEKYLNYLRRFEDRIPHSNYGADKFKPFFGELFTVDNLTYISQISHRQPRHDRMKNSLDFQKIYIPNSIPGQPDRFVAVVNLNYMFPIKSNMVTYLQFSKIDECRNFDNENAKSQYIDLLQKEMVSINQLNLENKAQRLYDLKKNFPNHTISARCLDYCMLEKYAKEYIE